MSQVHALWAGGSYINKVIFAPRYITTQISKHRVVRKRSYKDFDPVKFIDKDGKMSRSGKSRRHESVSKPKSLIRSETKPTKEERRVTVRIRMIGNIIKY